MIRARLVMASTMAAHRSYRNPRGQDAAAAACAPHSLWEGGRGGRLAAVGPGVAVGAGRDAPGIVYCPGRLVSS